MLSGPLTEGRGQNVPKSKTLEDGPLKAFLETLPNLSVSEGGN